MYLSSKKKDEPHEAGMGFTIYTAIISKLKTPHKGTNDKLLATNPTCQQEPPINHQCLCFNNDVC
jgi:hypothetical protein